LPRPVVSQALSRSAWGGSSRLLGDERGLPTIGVYTPPVAGMYDTAAAAELHGLPVNYVDRLVAGGEFAGAFNAQGRWYIPAGAIEARLSGSATGRSSAIGCGLASMHNVIGAARSSG